MKNTIKIAVALTVAALISFSFMQKSFAHCQIPCGIYDDHARVLSMLEDVATAHKSVSLIQEQHAQNIIDEISDYFLTQRVKTSQEDYAERLLRYQSTSDCSGASLHCYFLTHETIESILRFVHCHTFAPTSNFLTGQK